MCFCVFGEQALSCVSATDAIRGNREFVVLVNSVRAMVRRTSSWRFPRSRLILR